jgi:hypothetical protein
MTAQPVDNHLLGRILSGGDHDLDWDSFSPADWDRIVRLAQAEGVASLLYWKLTQSDKLSLLPDSLQVSLRALYYSLRMNNAELIRELKTLTRLFADAGIPVVALKGICFALTIYPEPALRPMVDLDLLVPASDLPKAVWIAKEAGYVEPVPEAFPGLDDLLSHAVGLQKTTAPFTVLELHHSLVAEKSFAYAVPMDWFWTQTEPLTGFDNLLMLTPTAQVLYASAHAMYQHGARNTSLRWFYDLDRLIRVHAERMDWVLLLAQAREFEWSSAASAALNQAISFFDTPVPSQVLDTLLGVADKNTELIETYQGQPATHTLEEFQKMKFLDWRGRIRMLLALLIPSPVYMRWRYELKNSWVLPAYYLYRWWGIFKDAIRTVIVLMQKSYSGIRLEGTPDKNQ